MNGIRGNARDAFDLVRHCARRFRTDQLAHVAGSLAFTSVLATVPLAAVVFGTIVRLPGFDELLRPVQAFLFKHLLPSTGAMVGERIESLSRNAGSLTAISAAILLVSALSLMATIERTFNDLWRAPRQRPLVQRLLTYWALVTLAPAMIGAGLALGARVGTLGWFTGDLGPVASAVISMVVGFVAFLVLFVALPNVRVRVGHAAAGAVFSTVLFEIARQLFERFIGSAVAYQAIYGAIAALPLFMLWVYVSWMVCLLGAILAATLHERLGCAPRSN